MARGFLSGVLWGGVFSAAVAGVVSVLAPPPMPPEVSDAAPGAAVAPERIAEAGSGEAGSDGDRAPVTGQGASQTTAPVPDTLAGIDADTLAPAAVPQTGGAEDLQTPTAVAEAGGDVPQADDPVLPNPQALAPMEPEAADEISISTEPAQPPVPQADDQVLPTPQASAPIEPEAAEELSISTEPAQPPVPETESVQGAFDVPEQPAGDDITEQPPVLPAVEDSGASGDGNSDAVERADIATDEGADTATDEEADIATDEGADIATDEGADIAPDEEADIATDESADIATDDSVDADIEIAQSSAPAAAPVAPELAEPVEPIDSKSAESAELPAAEPPIVVKIEPLDPPVDTQTESGPGGTDESATEIASTRPAIGRPAISLTDRSNGVIINRPRSGETSQVEVPDNALPIEAAAQPDAGMPPIEAFAQSFANPDNKPLMGIVLIDDGALPTSGPSVIAALRSFPYPISLAVDSSLDDAADRMALYRTEGFEVLAMVDLPEGATPADAETTFGVTLAKLPEVVGVLEGTRGGLQGSRDVADQVTEILLQSGHGLVTQDRGLNTMPKLARKVGVPANPVFRDFDSKGQTAQVIRRFLDQAAFKAGQEGAVIMLGRLRPDTITALLLWGLQDRAGQVALAPISAVLTRAE